MAGGEDGAKAGGARAVGAATGGTEAAATVRPIRWSHRLEAFGLRLATALLRLMPLDTASAFMGAAWRRIAPLTHRHKRVIAHLARAFPEKSEAERAAIAHAQWDNLGRVFAEALMLDRIAADPARIALPDEATRAWLHERAAEGLVLVSLHAGNWELATLAAIRLGLGPAGIYRPLSNPLSEQVLKAARAPFYPAGLYSRREGATLARRIVSLVRGGGQVAIVADLREGNGLTVRFFGRPASATPFPAMVARMADVPIVAGRVMRTEGAHFRVEIAEVPMPRTADRNADIQAGTQAIHDQFEAWIRETPEQWFWPHPKWLPDGDA